MKFELYTKINRGRDGLPFFSYMFFEYEDGDIINVPEELHDIAWQLSQKAGLTCHIQQ